MEKIASASRADGHQSGIGNNLLQVYHLVNYIALHLWKCHRYLILSILFTDSDKAGARPKSSPTPDDAGTEAEVDGDAGGDDRYKQWRKAGADLRKV